MNKLKIAGLAFVFLWFMGGGVMHFLSPEFFPGNHATFFALP